MSDVIDGTAEIVPSRELQRVSHEVIRPLDPGEVVGAMRTHQELLRKILDPSDWQGPPDATGSFVKKSGWRKVALAYNLALGRVSEEVERDEDGQPLRCTATWSAQAPNGRCMEASGHCAYAESRFRGNVSKLEHDMRATAETRAKNRAISDLVGMGRVSAEEVDAGGPAFGPSVNEAQAEQLRRAIGYVLDGLGDESTIDDVLGGICVKAGASNYVPVIAMQAVGLVAGALKRRRNECDPPSPRSDGPRADRTDSVLDVQVDEALRAREEIQS